LSLSKWAHPLTSGPDSLSMPSAILWDIAKL